MEHGRLWYRIHPGPEARPAVIVLHGGPGCPSDYLHPLSALADMATVVFYDQLGCGRSTRQVAEAALTLSGFAADLQTLLDHLQITSIVLLGHSFGALLALEHQRHHPHSASALVLASPLVATPDWMSDMAALIAALPEPYQTDICKPAHDPAYQAAETYFYRTHFCNLDPWPPLLLAAAEEMAVSPAYHLMWGPAEFSQTGTLAGVDRSGVLETLRCPVLFTCGSHDEARPETLKRYADRVTHGHVSVLDGGTHCVHLEQTADFLHVVSAFLTRPAGDDLL
ncbi:proline iminopeptidase-family hydrolase (plasmid) [Deinococcus taeanensis]|uniref:proline iminopeptidase-family hydrolase n=1 Tax=Deinococcus taeanensis TaxID=2737050 RepID=UPI001CDBF7EB|nr:proline iminopeptidase-family hydrolase [Deinococcus taeanensis]UBV44802.1 proline iminopeptidase-family hydrolase [Deinococcus taeanensis]